MPIAQINGHDMYYEVHGDGPPAVYIGGWDTFCHGRSHYLARGMTDQYSTVIIDYRGIYKLLLNYKNKKIENS